MRFVAHKSVKRNDRPVLPRAHVPHQRRSVNRRAHQLKLVFFHRFHSEKPIIPGPQTFAKARGISHFLFSNSHFLTSAPTHRRQKRNLIARGNARIPSRKLLIPRNHHRVPESRQFRIALRITLKHLSQRRSFRQLPSFLSQPGQFPQPPKEQHLHPQTWHNGCHSKIVTCPPPPRYQTPPTRHQTKSRARVGPAFRGGPLFLLSAEAKPLLLRMRLCHPNLPINHPNEEWPASEGGSYT